MENSKDLENNDDLSQTRRFRRPRNAGGERNYSCGCSKAYLSYPALYTHVKNKHNGIFPIGSHSRRKLPIAQLTEKNEALTISRERLMEELLDFFKEIKVLKEDNISKTDLSNIDDKNFKNNTIYEILTLDPFMDNYKNINKNLLDTLKLFLIKYGKYNNTYNIILNNQLILKESLGFNIYEVFCHFISEIFNFVSQDFFKEFIYLMIIYLETLSEKGYDFLFAKLDKEEKKKKEKMRQTTEFCSTKEVPIISETSNIFIAENFYREYTKNIKGKINMIYFGEDDLQIYNLIQIIKFYINWLYINDYSEFKAELNIDI